MLRADGSVALEGQRSKSSRRKSEGEKMKKINVDSEKCENYKRDTKKSSKLTQEVCLTCHFMLFARCWFNERNERTVSRALDGLYDDKLELHRRLSDE